MTPKDELSSSFLEALERVKQKRPRVIIDHLLVYGQITTEEIRDLYGYGHPPRAVRDVREHGIPIETFRVTGSDGRSIGAYRFGNPADLQSGKQSGRTLLSATLKEALIEEHGAKCGIYLENVPEAELQIDHRIPFEIAGEGSAPSEDPRQYMLLCPSANRAKSWSCENCENWRLKSSEICADCYWAYPEAYSHVAMREVRRLDLMWSGDEVGDYDALRSESDNQNKELPVFVKQVLRRLIDPSG